MELFDQRKELVSTMFYKNDWLKNIKKISCVWTHMLMEQLFKTFLYPFKIS